MNKLIMEDWLNEADTPMVSGQPDPAGGQSPMGDPNVMNQAIDMNDPNVANMMNQNFGSSEDDLQRGEEEGEEDLDQEEGEEGEEDVTQDPEYPDMPEEEEGVKDFESWKKKYFQEVVKGDSNNLIDMLMMVRDLDLEPYNKKFVEDNWNIQLLRQNSNIEKASKEIRRQVRNQLDRNNPATSLVNHLISVLETTTMLPSVFLKLNGYKGLKGDLHRKYISSLLCAVQVGNGSNQEDIIYNERDYSISISTRFNSEWGEVMLGNWSLRQDDPERFLSESEVKRLYEGNPEERDILRKRVVIESIADLFEKRAFIINVVKDNGTIQTMGWDISNSLRSAYADGILSVKVKTSSNSEAMITDEGEIIPYVDLSIKYVRETGEQNKDGFPEKEEIDFIERKNGMLFLKSNDEVLKEAATIMQGSSFKEMPYNGNPSELSQIEKCIYSSHDLLMRVC